MPRFRRQFSGAKPRRTNWIGSINEDDYQVSTVGGVTWTNWFSSHFNAGGEAAGYVAPTLVRIRGQLILDPVIPTTPGSTFGAAYAIIMVCNPAIVTDAPYVAMSPEDDAFSSDHIVWTGAIGWGFAVAEATAVGRFSIANQAFVLDVDVKAQRKLGDDKRIMVGVFNSGIGIGNVSWTGALRALLKE